MRKIAKSRPRTVLPRRAKRSHRLWLLCGLVGITGLLLLAVAHGALHGNATPAGTGLFPSFTLSDTTGRTIHARDFSGRMALLSFGYTYCPDICPTELGFEERVLKALGADAGAITPIFISVDPQRDTPRQLSEYTKLFDPRMIALTGTESQLHAAAAACGAMFERQADGTGTSGTYFIAHTSSIFVLGSNGEVLFIFDSHDDLDTTVGAIRTCLHH